MPATLTVLDVIQKSAAFLEGKGVENARLNAEWLIASALETDRMKLYMQFDRPLVDKELDAMRGKVARRAKREPLQYILGTAPFHELNLKVDSRALIPRPETEQLVEFLLETIEENDRPYRILDLGTGTGAIALALAFALPRAEIQAVDVSESALELAKENALFCGLQNRVEFLSGSWFEPLEGQELYDIIVSNPPYLTDAELESAAPEVRDHEPLGALVSPREGLADLEAIAKGSRDRLVAGGALWLETGIAHREVLLDLCRSLGFAEVRGVDDWSGRPRFVHARR